MQITSHDIISALIRKTGAFIAWHILAAIIGGIYG